MSPAGNSQRLVELLDSAIALAERRLTNCLAGGADCLSPEQLRSLLSALYEYKKQASSGNLESSEGGQLRLGLSRAVIDWGEPPGTPLRKTMFDIESYYENNY